MMRLYVDEYRFVPLQDALAELDGSAKSITVSYRDRRGGKPKTERFPIEAKSFAGCGWIEGRNHLAHIDKSAESSAKSIRQIADALKKSGKGNP